MQVAVERRPTLLLILVLGALFILMSFSTRTRVVGETRTMFERTVMTIFSPVPKAVNAIGRSASDIYHGYLDMRRAVLQNLELNPKVADLTKENLTLRQSYGDLARMRSILGYSEQFSLSTLLSQVIMLEKTGRFKSAVLDRGARNGVEVNDVVLKPGGLIGRVVMTTNDLSKVQLIIDSNASVGVLIERTRRQGLLRGDGSGGLQLHYVSAHSDIAPGDLVITGGIDGVYPKGIPVARVVRVEEGKGLFKIIACAPTVDFETIEEVIVLHTRKIPSEVMRYSP